jgi:flagellar biogenesis protein FliO
MRPGPSPLLRAWSWLQTKYVQTATKRLRVAETVSLGEKRFVSIVSIEGREFLIGGGASGVTLLAQLSPTQQEPASVGIRNIRGDVA